MIVRLVAVVMAPLIPEEAYYWMYAMHPDLSYYDHPPMGAWVIGAGCSLFGNTEFGVRIIGNLMMCAASLVMYRFARIWFDRTTALLSAVSLQVLPAYFATGFIATMDAPLVLFWLLCLLGLSLALRQERTWGWYLAGIGLGGAILSKYTGIGLAIGAFVAVAGCRPWRRQLLTIHPYAAAMLALAAFTPVLIWNSRHNWASFRFQLEGRFVDHGVQLKSLASFAVVQIVVLLPVLLAAALWVLGRAVRRPRRLRKPHTWFGVCLCMPLIAIFAWKSLKYDMHINWTLPAFLGVLPLLIHQLRAAARAQRRNASWWRWGPAAMQITFGCLMFNLLGPLYVVTLQPRLGFLEAFGPWGPMAAVVQRAVEQVEAATGRPPLVIVRGKYRDASVLAFERTRLGDGPNATNLTTSQWFIQGEGLGYEYWLNPSDFLGADCIYIGKKDQEAKSIRRSFDQVEKSSDPALAMPGDYQIFIGRGYRGPTPVRPQS